MEVRTPGGTLKAILRIGVHAGVSISTPSGLVPASIGIESGIFANVAEFVTNISVSDADNHSEDCAVKVIEEYASSPRLKRRQYKANITAIDFCAWRCSRRDGWHWRTYLGSPPGDHNPDFLHNTERSVRQNQETPDDIGRSRASK